MKTLINFLESLCMDKSYVSFPNGRYSIHVTYLLQQRLDLICKYGIVLDLTTLSKMKTKKCKCYQMTALHYLTFFLIHLGIRPAMSAD